MMKRNVLYIINRQLQPLLTLPPLLENGKNIFFSPVRSAISPLLILLTHTCTHTHTHTHARTQTIRGCSLGRPGLTTWLLEPELIWTLSADYSRHTGKTNP